MVRLMRSAKVAPGKYLQAIQWGKEMAEFGNRKYKLQISMFADNFGEIGTMRWFIDYPDLGTIEKIGDQILADQEYWTRIQQSLDLFQPGFTDTVMRAL
jgi:hypothetical protein